MNSTNLLILCLFFLPLLPLVSMQLLKGKWASRSFIMGNAGSFIAAMVLSLAINQDFNLTQKWIEISDEAGIPFSLKIDVFTLWMWLLISGLTLLIQIFSLWYMEHEPHIKRYFALLNIFMVAMLLVPAADNLLWLFMGWELVGITSYLLIGFWNDMSVNTKAATQALWTNRLGDVGFIIGMGCIYKMFGCLDLHIIQSNMLTNATFIIQEENFLLFHLGAAGFVLAALSKSAQFPLHIWLPDAMKGPTPVSALLHAATMVVAGVVLLLRLGGLLPYPILIILLLLALCSAAWATLLAISSNDLKRILAYSTIAQIGLMMAAIGAGSAFAAAFHVFTHAFFKAGLFLSAGFLLHHYHINGQTTDTMYLLKGKGTNHPALMLFMGIMLAALAGLPLTSGFLSKELLFEHVLAALSRLPSPVFYVGTALLAFIFIGTALYCFKLFFVLNNGFYIKSPVKSISKLPVYVLLPIFACTLGSVWLAFGWHPLQTSPHWFHKLSYIFIKPMVATGTILTKLLAPLLPIAGLGIGYIMLKKQLFAQPIHSPFFKLPELKMIFSRLFMFQMQTLSQLTNYNDKKLIDGGLHFFANANILLAHLVSYFDSRLVDGVFKWVAITIYQIGKVLKSIHANSSRQLIQNTLIILIMIFILLYLI
jgi:NADH-quinone oxidoreductase subunit L